MKSPQDTEEDERNYKKIAIWTNVNHRFYKANQQMAEIKCKSTEASNCLYVGQN